MCTSYLVFIRRVASFLRGALLLLLLAPSPKDLRAETRSFPSPEAKFSWEKTLYYSKHFFKPPSSLVDSPDFFLAKDGKANSESELQAFISRLASDAMDKPEPERVSCAYPARRAWVAKYRPDITLPQITCPLFENWLKISQPVGLSIIFSSYFVNNPSSMMGHTFLRIRRGSANNSPLLDQSVNFAANPSHDIPILYNYDGLAGNFPGTFAMLPYYLKVQEYANAESRDLWEYDLALTKEETMQVMNSLWEVIPQYIDYYFFDENCSAILLYLIQNARPEIDLTSQLGGFVHPSDTLRYLMEKPGLVKDIVYRPSSRSRYLAQFNLLAQKEKDALETIKSQKSLSDLSFTERDEVSRARIVDAALAFVEFDEQLYGAKKSVRFAGLYDQLLAERVKLSSPPLLKFDPPLDEAPHLGHKGRRLGLGLGSYEGKGEVQLEYRPGQHDLLSPAVGYPPELSIQLGKTRLNFVDEQTARVRSFEVFHIQSFNPSRLGRFAGSWQLQSNFENTRNKKYQIFGSIGQSSYLGSREDFGFLFYDTRMKVQRGEFYICPGASTGARLSIAKRFTSFSDIGIERCYGKETDKWRERWSQEFRLSVSDNLEFYAEARKYVDAREFTLGLYRYY